MRTTEASRRLILAAATFVVAVVTVGLHLAEVLEEAELPTVDARHRLVGGSGAPDDVVVVAVDDGTLAALGREWPLPAAVHADLLDALTATGVRAVVVDAPFDEAAVGDPALLGALGRAPAVVLASTRSVDGEPLVLGGAPALALDRVSAADARLDPDDDGTVRRFAAEDDDGSGLGDPLPLAAAVAAGEDVDLDVGDEGASVAWAGAAGAVDTVSAISLLTGEADPARLEGRIAFVGVTAAGVGDRHRTPFEERMAGVEVLANMTATTTAHFPLRLVEGAAALAVIVVVALVPTAVAGRLSSTAGILATSSSLLAYLVVAVAAFSLGVVVPVVAPVVGLALATVAVVAVNYAFVSLERRRVRAVFGRFVPEHVVREVVDADADGSGDLLRARTGEVTVLFSDIRGFTSYAEGRDPVEVIEVLNDYLGSMTDVVLEEGGTLVNYMGDGIMAVFGAPDPDPDHAGAALRAARRMLAGLDAFNARRRDDGPPFRIGIGLHSGPVVAGNIGTVRRLTYTMIGDTVNTAARIEGMTKEAPGDVLVSEATVDALGDPPADLVRHATLPVRGRDGSVTLWALRDQRAPA